MRAYVFPGQGSQFPGMGYDLYRRNKKAARIFDFADELLGFKISQIMFKGTEEDLGSSEIAQLAILIHSMAITSCEKHFNPRAVAGHSFGEYSALTAVGALKFEDALIVMKNTTNRLSAVAKGKLVAIIGLPSETIKSICKNIKDTVEIANYNSPGQIVVGGTLKGIQLATKKLKHAGAKKTIELKVDNAFHTSMLKPAIDTLKNILEKVHISAPSCPVYQNLDGNPTRNPDVIKYKLLEQIISPVMWIKTIENMIRDGFNHFEEVSQGEMLQGLIRRINSTVNVSSFRC